eukprot:TRINITY_DN7730_c0_g1_i2.p1 TRINITY_DN7730_c0_g1~~TRINITY_DN7730_c0_g1_i2.p1  ORF type:complete len:452 (+),score=61.92 TRINITY_DN7730_c0_g1_i2:170-1525(+)
MQHWRICRKWLLLLLAPAVLNGESSCGNDEASSDLHCEVSQIRGASMLQNAHAHVKLNKDVRPTTIVAPEEVDKAQADAREKRVEEAKENETELHPALTLLTWNHRGSTGAHVENAAATVTAPGVATPPMRLSSTNATPASVPSTNATLASASGSQEPFYVQLLQDFSNRVSATIRGGSLDGLRKFISTMPGVSSISGLRKSISAKTGVSSISAVLLTFTGLLVILVIGGAAIFRLDEAVSGEAEDPSSRRSTGPRGGQADRTAVADRFSRGTQPQPAPSPRAPSLPLTGNVFRVTSSLYGGPFSNTGSILSTHSGEGSPGPVAGRSKSSPSRSIRFSDAGDDVLGSKVGGVPTSRAAPSTKFPFKEKTLMGSDGESSLEHLVAPTRPRTMTGDSQGPGPSKDDLMSVIREIQAQGDKAPSESSVVASWNERIHRALKQPPLRPRRTGSDV